MAIADQIRQALEKRDGISAQSMSPLAASYQQEAERVNVRLQEAVALLRKGLRAEAIQRASLRPNALEAAAALDFPEVEEWFEVLQFLEVPLPTPVDQDAVQQINEAIVETQPLAELFKRHRRLAIAKAPLPWRLKVLRRIAALDPMNGVWQEDLESWETERGNQIASELKLAIEQDDAQTIDRLHEEISSTAWLVEPNPKLIQEIKAKKQQNKHAADLTNLTRIAPLLHDAFCQFDDTRAKQLRSEWNQVVARMATTVPADLDEQVEPALAWLSEMDDQESAFAARKASIEKLERILDSDKPTTDIQRAYREASRFEEPIPEALVQRFHAVIAERELRQRAKTRFMIGAAVASCISVAAMVGFWQWQSAHKASVAKAASELKALVDTGEFTQADQLYNRIAKSQPNVINSPDIATLKIKIDEQIAAERERANRFESLLAAASDDDPSLIDLQALRDAKKLAASDADQARVYDIERMRSKWEREQTKLDDKALLERLAVHESNLDRIEAGTANPAAVHSVSQILTDLDNDVAKFSKHSYQLKARTKLTRDRAVGLRDAMQDTILKADARSDGLEKIVRADSLQELAEGITAYERALPETYLSREFNQVLSETSMWRTPQLVSQWFRDIDAAAKRGLSPAEVKRLSEQREKLAQKIEVDALLQQGSRLTDLFEEVAGRAAILDEGFQKISAQTISELVTVLAPAEIGRTQQHGFLIYRTHFEQTRDAIEGDGNLGVEVVVNESAAVQRRGLSAPRRIVMEPAATLQWLSEREADNRQKFLADWDAAFLATLAALRQRPQLDGIIKELLMLQVMEVAIEGSSFLRTELEPELTFLKRRKDARKRWYEPKPFNAKLAFEVESRVIPALASAYKRRTTPSLQIREAVNRSIDWVGVLLRRTDGNMDVTMHRSPTDTTGDLYTLRPSSSSPKIAALEKIGSWNGKVPTLNRSRSGLLSGRPVFLVSKADSDSK
ncbi:hypothetical protein [Crateriforma conspicua]|uniref:Uncharacterized protein n=1 Tax=Crateriforma conspicua TaxID=2527996 RepID=A0A5C6FX91_9PLAN|nr:hypothetical protein [Crateriforma conspicua]TWU65938.1 hypothetical protein V7x_14920 [Crateriforma conspicua]